MAVWLKAVFDYGMNQEEIYHYTKAMLKSGVQLDFSYLKGFIVDKHSTGGIGDKVSIILAPLLAACGCYVPMLAGRGLEHTGGTIDKLETIPGYQIALDIKKFSTIVENVGASIMSQTIEICPADRKIYKLRDVTNTVASFPLICGSIMSKKIAEGIQVLVLDIKVGNGAFMKTLNEGKRLGSLLKQVGNTYGIQVETAYTNMNQPLGNSAGLWCEILESVECLKGNGPNDVMRVVYHLGEMVLKLVGFQYPQEMLKIAISDGSALKKFKEMVEAHGGSTASLDDSNTHTPKYSEKVYAERDGYIISMNTLSLGMAIKHLGGGCTTKMHGLDPTVGIVFHKKVGDKVNNGDILLEYFCSQKDKFIFAKKILQDVYDIDSEIVDPISLVY